MKALNRHNEIYSELCRIEPPRSEFTSALFNDYASFALMTGSLYQNRLIIRRASLLWRRVAQCSSKKDLQTLIADQFSMRTLRRSHKLRSFLSGIGVSFKKAIVKTHSHHRMRLYANIKKPGILPFIVIYSDSFNNIKAKTQLEYTRAAIKTLEKTQEYRSTNSVRFLNWLKAEYGATSLDLILTGIARQAFAEKYCD